MSLGRVLLVSLAVLAAGYGIWRYWWTALDHHPEQDACSFGPVTNAEYRQMLARVKALQAEGKGVWAPLTGPTRSSPWSSPPGSPGSPQQLASRMNELSAGVTSLYERRMIMHAVMRAAGAYLHSAHLSGRNDFSRLPVDLVPNSFIHADYALHSNYRGDGHLQLAAVAVYPIWLLGQVRPELQYSPLNQDIEQMKSTNRFQASGLAVELPFGWPNPAGVPIFGMPSAEACLPELEPRIAELYSNWAVKQQ